MFNSPDIFVDVSYVTYFTMHSTWSWYKKEFILDDNDYRLNGDFDPSTDPEFALQLEKRFGWNVYGLINKIVPLADKGRIVFAIDCSKKYIWRNHYFPQYKLKRYHTKTPYNFKGSFEMIVNDYIPSKCEQDGSKMIKVNNAEADDIIGHIILQKRKSGDDRENIIIASDRDLSQLCSTTTKMYDIFKKQITMETSYKKDKVIDQIDDCDDVGTFLLYKALKGDNSDGIPSPFGKCGPKTSIKYINNREMLTEACKKNPQAVKNLKRNLMIMDLRQIPKQIQNDIWNSWKGVDESN